MTHAVKMGVDHHPDDRAQIKRIWKTFWLLLILTIAELGLGLAIYNIYKGDNPNETLVLIFKGIVCILTLAKAFYIVAVFMHLGDEIRNLVMTIIVPLLLFIWFIAAFLYEGAAWREAKNTDAGSRKYEEPVKQKTPAVDKGKKN